MQRARRRARRRGRRRNTHVPWRERARRLTPTRRTRCRPRGDDGNGGGSSGGDSNGGDSKAYKATKLHRLWTQRLWSPKAMIQITTHAPPGSQHLPSRNGPCHTQQHRYRDNVQTSSQPQLCRPAASQWWTKKTEHFFLTPSLHAESTPQSGQASNLPSWTPQPRLLFFFFSKLRICISTYDTMYR